MMEVLLMHWNDKKFAYRDCDTFVKEQNSKLRNGAETAIAESNPWL